MLKEVVNELKKLGYYAWYSNKFKYAKMYYKDGLPLVVIHEYGGNDLLVMYYDSNLTLFDIWTCSTECNDVSDIVSDVLEYFELAKAKWGV